jgi:hypothetical protein
LALVLPHQSHKISIVRKFFDVGGTSYHNKRWWIIIKKIKLKYKNEKIII